MAQKKLKIYITCLVSSIWLFCTPQTYACGFYETEADYRAMMFKVSLPSFASLQPFNYTTSSFYYLSVTDALTSDPYSHDRYQNCMEWQVACEGKPSIDDIYVIQYDTDPLLFIGASKDNSLNTVFENNSFVKYLTNEENKALLDYMLFAKEAEMYETGSYNRFEEWDDIRNYYRRWNDNGDKAPVAKRELLGRVKSILETSMSSFLKERYAFQACRLYCQLGQPSQVIETYNENFKGIDKNSLMSIWAGLFKAIVTPSDNIERYRLLIQVFDNSEEKKFRTVRLFDNDFDENELSPKELSTAIVMQTLRNPGKALDEMRKAYKLNPANELIPFLVLREINKLEDWLITPVFYKKYSITHDDPFHGAYRNRWYEEEIDQSIKLQQENLSTDMQYIADLKSFLVSLLPKSKGDIKDFYAVGLAHLSLLEENTQDAYKYMNMITDKANPSILLQKKLETIWLSIKTQNIESDKFQKIFIENIKDIERISMTNFDNSKMLYTLTLSLANEFIEKGNRVFSNLLRLKSEWYKNRNDEWYNPFYSGVDSYSFIEYFDKNGTVSDMDIFINLLNKSKKAPFEDYLFDQPLSSINAYKELKGTIAFRDDNLKLAHETFASMPQDYWQSENFFFSSYLNEDPFIPKGIKGNKHRSFDYKFNKADFVKELMRLQDEAGQNNRNSADYYNKLGDAYFNTTYWGNSWMMMHYGWSVDDENYSVVDRLPKWMCNYMTAEKAQSYYERAIEEANNDEQKAYATVMLRYIHYLNFSYRAQQTNKIQAEKYMNELKDYEHTKAFQIYKSNCIAPFIVN